MVRKFLSSIVVRNPRNLERLHFARKSQGFQFEKDFKHRSYYYRAELDFTGKHTIGLIRHHKDGIVLTASTMEWPISKRLYSNTDVSAALNIGSILGRRCLQAGITAVHSMVAEDSKTSEKVEAFYGALENQGIELCEPDFIEPSYEEDARYHWEAKEDKDKHPALF